MAAVWYPNNDRDYWNRLKGKDKPSKQGKQQKHKDKQKSKNLSNLASAYFRALLDYKRDFCKRAKYRYYRCSSPYFCKRKIIA